MNDTNKIRILSFGAGAIGTYIGGSLALNGHPVSFIERPVMIEYLRENPLRLNINGTDRLIPQPNVFSSLEEALQAGEYDVALFALKSYDTRAALEDIKPYAMQIPPIMCLQNGVENEGWIAEAIGKEKVISCTITSAIGRRNVGDIIIEKNRGMGIANQHPLSETLVAALNQAGIRTQLFENAENMKWSKMITNLLSNATSAILAMPPAQVFENSDSFNLEMLQIKETLAVMRAKGIRVVDLPGVPVKALTFAIQYLPDFIKQPILINQVGGGRGDKMPSFYIDMQSGRGVSEVTYLNGAVSRLGAETGVPTPVNHFLTETLMSVVKAERSPDVYQHNPQKLYADFIASKS